MVVVTAPVESTGLAHWCEDRRHLHCKSGSETGVSFEEGQAESPVSHSHWDCVLAHPPSYKEAVAQQQMPLHRAVIYNFKALQQQLWCEC